MKAQALDPQPRAVHCRFVFWVCWEFQGGQLESWKDLGPEPLDITNGRLKPRAGSWPRASRALGRARLAEDPWAGPVPQGLAFSVGKRGMHLCGWLRGVLLSCHWLAWIGPRLVETCRGAAQGAWGAPSAGDSAELVFPGLQEVWRVGWPESPVVGGDGDLSQPSSSLAPSHLLATGTVPGPRGLSLKCQLLTDSEAGAAPAQLAGEENERWEVAGFFSAKTQLLRLGL